MNKLKTIYRLLITCIICLSEEFCTMCKFLKYEIRNSDERKFAFLRACCHVLDKGLESINFEEGHGKTVYIAAKKLRDELAYKYGDDRSFKWINDIICEYEEAQKTGVTRRHNFDSSSHFGGEEKQSFVNFLKSRTSCRNYDGRKIDTSVLKELVEIAIDAPIGCCRQTVRYYITQNDDDLKSIQEHVSGMSCFSNIPCIALVYVKSSVYKLVDRKMQYIDASLSVENFVLAAHANNIGTTICNFSSSSMNDYNKVRQIFDIPNDETPVVAITLGYSISTPQKPLRMDLERFMKIK